MGNNNSPYEIERKFLIKYPDVQWLKTHGEATYILQVYLLSEPGQCERVRKRWNDKSCRYTHTTKIHITNIKRIEIEDDISLEEYNSLLKRADSSKKIIEKTRYCLPYSGQIFEIDIYPFYSDRAIMEIELIDESQDIFFPPQIEIIKEVTDDRRYTNSSLAEYIPYDDIS